MSVLGVEMRVQKSVHVVADIYRNVDIGSLNYFRTDVFLAVDRVEVRFL